MTVFNAAILTYVMTCNIAQCHGLMVLNDYIWQSQYKKHKLLRKSLQSKAKQTKTNLLNHSVIKEKAELRLEGCESKLSYGLPDRTLT